MSDHEGKPDRHCTVEELTAILDFNTPQMELIPVSDMDEVWPSLFIGDQSSARNIQHLKRQGVTHVLNTAVGTTPYHVNINDEFYQKSRLIWKGIKTDDIMNFHLDTFFPETTAFIKEAIDLGGKVLVHCRQGYSRSATITIAYLMTYHHMTAQDAIRHICQHRYIGPNEGFLQQLSKYNEELWGKGHFAQDSG